VKCGNCGSTRVIVDDIRGEVVCADCGYVLSSEVIDDGPDWRYYTEDERIRRSRGEPSEVLGSRILGCKDIRGNAAPSFSQRKKINKITALQDKITSSRLIKYIVELERLSSGLKLPKYVKQHSLFMFKKIYEKRLLNGKSFYGFLGASILFSCKKYNIKRDLKEISTFSKADIKEIKRCYRRIVMSGLFGKPPLQRPEDHALYLATTLSLSKKTRDLAISMLSEIRRDPRFRSKRAASLAAAVVYISSILLGERRRQEEIARKAGIAVSTLRKNVSLVMKNIDIEVKIVATR